MKPVWTTALPDWERRIVAGESLVPVSPLFPAQADYAMGMMRELRLRDVMGSPTMGDVCRPWITDFAAAVFGAFDPNSQRRLIREFMLLISKKNGKSTTAAGIMLTALLANVREAAEFLILAPTVKAANSAFKPAADMIRLDGELRDLLKLQDYQRLITHTQTGATLQVIAADTDAVAGNKATGVLIDELWLFGQRANAESMFTEATGGLASRPEGFVIYLSTQSDQPPAGVFKSKLDYARAVRDGEVIDPEFMPVLYEFPRAMIEAREHLKPDNFRITNPNLGASVDIPFLEREYQKAVVAGEEKVKDFLAKHLNVEIGLNLRSDRWAGADFWEAAADKTITLDSLVERCEVAVVGIDGGGLDDLLGLTVIGREKETRRWLLWSHAWAHEIVLERRKEVAPRLMDFKRDGDLTIVAKPGDDVQEVADIVCRLSDAGLLPEKNAIGVDSAGIGDVVDELMSPERGIVEGQIIAISQGWKLNAAIKTAERKIAGGEMVHGGRPLMNWCISNAKIETRSNSILVTKQASGSAKIDPVMAMFDAVALMSLNPESSAKEYRLHFV